METLIKEFLDSNLRNAWLETSDIKLYVRKGHHLIDGKLCQTFDVASVEVVENKRGCGIFRNTMFHVEQLGMTVYVESILNRSSKLTKI